MTRIGHRPESGFNSSKDLFRIRVGTLIWVQLEGKLQIMFPARFHGAWIGTPKHVYAQCPEARATAMSISTDCSADGGAPGATSA